MKPEDLRELLFRRRINAYRAAVEERQQSIIDINAAAKAAGMTYGKYVAMLREEEQKNDKRQRKPKKV